jgi:hypothetical protein
MNQSEQINELITALAKAQGQMKAAIKDSTNPHFKSKYADLASVWDACRDPLSNNGLAVTQTVTCDTDKQVLITMLGHSSGQWIRSNMVLPIQKGGPQELGSCLSYCRRYSLAAMVGVFQDDDDGERVETSNRKVDSKPAMTVLPDHMIQLVSSFLKDDPDALMMLNNRFRPEWKHMPVEKFAEVAAWLKERKEKRIVSVNE